MRWTWVRWGLRSDAERDVGQVKGSQRVVSETLEAIGKRGNRIIGARVWGWVVEVIEGFWRRRGAPSGGLVERAASAGPSILR